MRTTLLVATFLVLVVGCNHPREWQARFPEGLNPFSPTPRICFPVEAGEQTMVTLFDVQGTLRAVLFDTTLTENHNICIVDSAYYRSGSTDTHASPLSFNSLEDGVYFYKVETPDSAYTRNILMMR